MSEKRRELYARLGLQLLHNRRAFEAERAAEGAMAVYLYCVMYARAEMTDGFVPLAVVEYAWGRPRTEAIRALVLAGLLSETDSGVLVERYGDHNDTRKDVESNREAVRKRMRRLRKGRVAGDAAQTRHMGEHKRVGDADVPISISLSTSLSSEDQIQKTKSTRRAKSGAGTRLPEDWTLSDNLLQWARGKGLTESDARKVAERFANHWWASSTDSAVKVSWDAAYRTWVNRDIEEGKIVPMPKAAPVKVTAPSAEVLEQRQRTQVLLADAVAAMRRNSEGA